MKNSAVWSGWMGQQNIIYFQNYQHYVKIQLCLAEGSSSPLCIYYVLLNWKYFTYIIYFCKPENTISA